LDQKTIFQWRADANIEETMLVATAVTPEEAVTKLFIALMEKQKIIA
jgi:hypothetical protein